MPIFLWNTSRCYSRRLKRESIETILCSERSRYRLLGTKTTTQDLNYITQQKKRFPLCPPIDEVVQGSFKEKSPPSIRASGFVKETLECVLWGFYHSSNFEVSKNRF